MADIQAIAQQFVTFYYNQFDSDRSQLQGLYRPQSMLSWEQKQIQGATNIVEHLSGLPFSKVQHQVATLDAQPSSTSQASILVLVTGQLLVDDSANTLNYSQAFQLVPEGSSYFVLNDIFRLVYG